MCLEGRDPVQSARSKSLYVFHFGAHYQMLLQDNEDQFILLQTVRACLWPPTAWVSPAAEVDPASVCWVKSALRVVPSAFLLPGSWVPFCLFKNHLCPLFCELTAHNFCRFFYWLVGCHPIDLWGLCLRRITNVLLSLFIFCLLTSLLLFFSPPCQVKNVFTKWFLSVHPF